MLEDIFKEIKPVQEGNFSYYEIGKIFDVSINTIDRNTEIAPHNHDQDVHNYVFYGQLTVITHEGERVLRKGDWWFIPAGKRHSVKITEPVCLLELWKK